MRVKEASQQEEHRRQDAGVPTQLCRCLAGCGYVTGLSVHICRMGPEGVVIKSLDCRVSASHL